MPLDNVPGIIARVKCHGSKYDDLLDQATTHFDRFFNSTHYTIVGAEIQPGQVDEGIGGSQIISWDGMFYAMPDPRPSDLRLDTIEEISPDNRPNFEQG